MENIFLSYFSMCSERTVLSSMQHDFFAKF